VTTLEPLTQFFLAGVSPELRLLQSNQSYVEARAHLRWPVREKFKSDLKETSPLKAVPR
jgi:hypothetical protein